MFNCADMVMHWNLWSIIRWLNPWCKICCIQMEVFELVSPLASIKSLQTYYVFHFYLRIYLLCLERWILNLALWFAICTLEMNLFCYIKVDFLLPSFWIINMGSTKHNYLRKRHLKGLNRFSNRLSAQSEPSKIGGKSMA